MKNNYLYTIRRHLGKGKHFGWWQIREYITNAKQGEIVEYIDPDKFCIIFRTCFLYNRPKTAQKIFDGAYKQPCAWICAGSYMKEPANATEIIDDYPSLLEYNPKKSIHWTSWNVNMDGVEHEFIYTKGTKLYI